MQDLLGRITLQEILQDYPLLEPDDIQAALFYARNLVASELVFESTVL